MRSRFPLLVCLAAFGLPSAAWSKGQTIGIAIRGAQLAEPILITDPAIVGRFSIWNGPGVWSSSRGPTSMPEWADPELTSGRFIDWPRGWARERPAQVQRLEVTFYIGDRAGSRRFDDDLVSEFVFLYEVDLDSGHGFVYLPRWKNDLVLHFVEGNWLHAAAAWDETIVPLLAAAPTAATPSPLRCMLGTATPTHSGAIEVHLLDGRGESIARLVVEPTSRDFADFEARLGTTAPGRSTPLSCWPPQT